MSKKRILEASEIDKRAPRHEQRIIYFLTQRGLLKKEKRLQY